MIVLSLSLLILPFAFAEDGGGGDGGAGDGGAGDGGAGSGTGTGGVGDGNGNGNGDSAAGPGDGTSPGADADAPTGPTGPTGDAGGDGGVIPPVTPPTNNPPIFTSGATFTINEGQLLTFTVTAVDPEGAPVTITAVGLPTGATFVGNVFSWTPTFFQSGIYTVTFIASDGVNTATQIVTITVVDTNGPPQFSGFNAAYTINEGQFLAFTVTATDPEGLPVTLTVAGLPFGATFAGNVFSWTPNFAQAGVYVVTFTASDGMLVSTTTVTITVLDVTPPAGNRAPILDRIGDKLAFIGKRLMFLVTGSDPDGDTIMFSASSLPKGASFIGNTFDWTPGKDQEGTYKVRFTVSDGALSDSELIEIDVEDESFDITLHMLAFPDGDEVAAGDQLLALVNLQNEGNVEIDDVRIRAYFMDEGLTVLSDAFDLDPQEQASRLLTFDIPVDMAPGEYYVGFSVRNADVTRVVYREIEVV